MTTEVSPNPYDWIKQLPSAVFQADEIPLFGNAPPFPWEKLGAAIGNLFKVEEVILHPLETQWRSHEDLLSGIHTPHTILYVTFATLEGTFAWVMAQQDLDELMRLLLAQPLDAIESVDPQFREGFSRFLAAEILQLIGKLDFDPKLSPTLSESGKLSYEPSLCIDVDMKVNDTHLFGRGIISPELRHSWKERFSEHRHLLNYNTPLGQKLQVIAHLEVGKTTLTVDDFRSIQTGDYIILDHCSMDPSLEKGRISITVNDVPLFRARIKQGQIKILEFPLYHEVETPMNNNHKGNEKKNNEEDLSEEEDLSFDETIHEDKTESGMDTDTDEEFEVEEEEIAEGVTEIKKAPAGAAAALPPGVKKPEEKSRTIDANTLPLNLIVEIGRIQMSVQKLMELQPGNVLELDIHPESGVDLVVNGKCIGKGELLKIGESLGVRVLDLG